MPNGEEILKEKEAQPRPYSSLRQVIQATIWLFMQEELIYLGIGGWSALWCIIFFAVLLYNFKYGISAEAWAPFWHFFIWMVVIIASLTAIWFTAGGLIDLKKMFRRLKTMKRDHFDDGELLDEKQ